MINVPGIPAMQPPLHKFSARDANSTYTLKATVAIEYAYLVIQTYDEDTPNPYLITSMKANNTVMVAGKGDGVPCRLFDPQSRKAPLLYVGLSVGDTMTVTISGPSDVDPVMTLIPVPYVETP